LPCSSRAASLAAHAPSATSVTTSTGASTSSLAERAAHEAEQLLARDAVTDRDGLDAVPLRQLRERVTGAGALLGRVEMHGRVVEVLPLGVDDGDLAAAARRRIDAERGDAPERRRHQEMAHLADDLGDRDVVRGRSERLLDRRVDRGPDVLVERAHRRAAEHVGAGRVRDRARVGLHHRAEAREELRVLGTAPEPPAQLTLVHAAPDGQVAPRTVPRAEPRGRPPEVEAAREAAAVLRALAARHLEPGVALRRLAHARAERPRLGDLLDEDVLGSGDRLLGVRDALILVPERERPELERLAGCGVSRPWPQFQIHSASGPSPASRAAAPGVCRRRLNGRYRSSSRSRSNVVVIVCSRSDVSRFCAGSPRRRSAGAHGARPTAPSRRARSRGRLR
jgi:hypothetical protein